MIARLDSRIARLEEQYGGDDLAAALTRLSDPELENLIGHVRAVLDGTPLPPLRAGGEAIGHCFSANARYRHL